LFLQEEAKSSSHCTNFNHLVVTHLSPIMSDGKITFPMQIPFLSMLPVEDEEIKCLAVLMHNKPFGKPSDMSVLKTECGSWKAAHEAFTNELKTKYLDSNKTDQQSYNILHAMHRMMTSTSESVKEEYLQLKKMHANLDIVSLDWPSLCALADPELMARAGMAGGMRACCWTCGGRAGPDTPPLLTCSKCEKATYCSRDCQVASWWHHKRTKKNDLACLKED
jgi:hypothetical protein